MRNGTSTDNSDYNEMILSIDNDDKTSSDYEVTAKITLTAVQDDIEISPPVLLRLSLARIFVFFGKSF